MYNLLIADDEFQIRTLLSTVVDWKSLGFNIVGLFEDGQDVIDYITTNHVDCILSDIRMINVSGIELAEYLYTNYPKIKLVLLSGYQEFEYAVSALKFNVENYLLKPTKINDLTSIFSLLKAKLDNEINDMSIISCYRREVFGKLKDGHYKDDETFPNILKSLNIDIELSNSCALVNINFDAPIKVEENIRSTFFQNFALITESNIKGFYISGTSQSVEYILFSTNSSSNNFKDFAQKICECISEFSKTRAKISNFNFFESIKKLQSIEPYAKTNYENIDQILIKEQEKVLISVINSGNSLEVKNQLNMIFNILSMLTLLELKKYVKNLITFTNDELLADDGVSKKKIDDFLNEINSCNSLNQLRNISYTFFINQAEYLKNIDNDLSRESVILKVRDYIIEHYSEDLLLEDVASMVYLSPTYFSKIFKSIIGQNYIDFLISYRMNMAKQFLINTQTKVYEIGIKVGYENPNFFTRLFKANCGLSPTEYRNKFAKRVY